jgi:hypothetical protein
VRLALERLEPYEASLLDAVDYFIKFAKPPKGKVTIQEAMDSFERDNSRRGLSEAYLTRSRAFFSQFRNAFGNRENYRKRRFDGSAFKGPWVRLRNHSPVSESLILKCEF